MAARTITLEELRLRCRQQADMERSTKVGDSELDGMINSSIGEFHDMIVGNAEDWLLTYLPLSLTGSAYELPSDHWRTRGVDRVGTDGSHVPLRRQEFEDRGTASFFGNPFVVDLDQTGLRWNVEGDVLRFFPAGQAPGNVRLTYVPSSPVLSGSAATLGRPYTINGWDEWITRDVAAKMLVKEESDPTDNLERRDEIGARIAVAAKRDETGVREVAFVRTGRSSLDWMSRTR
jgi:hypothetical protein